MPPGLDAQVRPRSGLARRGVIKPLGTIDADYRGEIFVTLYTVSPEIRHVVEHGDRIAQLVIGSASRTSSSPSATPFPRPTAAPAATAALVADARRWP